MLSPERSRIRSCPKRSIQTFVLCPSLLLSNENLALLHFFANAEIIFAYILVFPACVIEVQHSGENYWLNTIKHTATFCCFHSTASDLIDAVQLTAATCSYPGYEVVVFTFK